MFKFTILLHSVECSVVVKHAKFQASLMAQRLRNRLQARDLGLIPGLGRSPGGEHGNPLQYSCLEKKSHGQRSLAGYSPWGCKESDMTEQLSTYMKRFSWTVLSPCSAPSPLLELRLNI